MFNVTSKDSKNVFNILLELDDENSINDDNDIDDHKEIIIKDQTPDQLVDQLNNKLVAELTNQFFDQLNESSNSNFVENDNYDNHDSDQETNDILYDDKLIEYPYEPKNDYKKYEYINQFKKNVWKKKDSIYCNNCGKYGHIYKKCFDPITSFGIICINLNNPKIYDFFMAKYKFPNESQILKNICITKYIQKNISCNNRKDLDIFEQKIDKNTKYLMVRRKHTYNFIHIIRGLYDLEIESIIKSINLLTAKEFNDLITLDFDTLWNNLWEENNVKKKINNDYKKAKEQFELLKTFIIPQILHKIKIIYEVPEWGFPKGKRNNNETNLECAKREFEEETGILPNQYEILDRLYPLNENIKGSNGINYRHIYYIAVLKPQFNELKLSINNEIQEMEIGDIGYFNAENIKEMLRPYNTEKIDIISNIKLFLTYNTRYFEKFYHENK